MGFTKRQGTSLALCILKLVIKRCEKCSQNIYCMEDFEENKCEQNKIILNLILEASCSVAAQAFNLF